MPNSLFTAVSGLLAHQRRLDIVANNLANQNTTAYKTNRGVFSDLFYEFTFAREEDFGEGVGEAMRKARQRYLNLYGTSALNVAQVQQFIVNGDPAVKIFGENRHR